MKRMILCVVALMLIVSGLSVAKDAKQQLTTKKKRECVLEDLATSGLGDVKYSILSEAQFQAVNGPEWVLMSGQEVPAVETGNNSLTEFLTADNNSMTAVPDARGLFLRGKNNALDLLTGNPAGDLLLGSRQEDAFEDHAHTSYVQIRGDNTMQYIAQRDWSGGMREFTTSGAITGKTDVETRPRNITVNIFVKIKRKCLDAVAVAKMEENTAKITAIEDYNATNVCDACLTMSETDLAALNAKYTCFEGEIDAYDLGQKVWSKTCLARTIGYAKKVLMLIGENRTPQQDTDLAYLDTEYPYYNVISTSSSK